MFESEEQCAEYCESKKETAVEVETRVVEADYQNERILDLARQLVKACEDAGYSVKGVSAEGVEIVTAFITIWGHSNNTMKVEGIGWEVNGKYEPEPEEMPAE